MDWRSIIRAVAGEPAAMKDLMQMDRNEWSYAGALIGALLLLEDAPHPAAALVVAGIAAQRAYGRPVAAALAPHAARALAEWRAEPTWAKRRIGSKYTDDLIYSVAHLIAELHDDPAALRDAVAVVAHNGKWMSIDADLAALGGDGWGLLADEERGALWTRAARANPAALGFVWPALTDAQREEAAQRAAANAWTAAALIGCIGAAAWTTTDAAVRRRLIDAAVQAPSSIHHSAPAWTGMSDTERARLVTAVVDDGEPWDAYRLLHVLGGDGRRALFNAQRVTLDALATQISAKMTALLRVGDDGWDGVSDNVRRKLMAWSAMSPPGAADFIRAVGSDGWRALPPYVQKRLRASVQREARMLLACPPALWVDLSDGRSLPTAAMAIKLWVFDKWRAEDADADLSRLPREHQTTVLALAPWRGADCAPSAPRMARLLDVWNGMTADARIDLATALPQALAVVAAAARLCACARTTAAVADALESMARVDADAAARATVGRMLAETGRWRPWMRAFAPTDDNPLEVWKPWLAAAQRSAILDRGFVLRLMAHGARRANRRVRRGRGGG